MDMTNTLFPTTAVVELTFVASFGTRKHISMSRAILSNFFEVNSKSLTIAIGSVACTFSDNLSRSFSEKVQPTILKGIVGVFCVEE